jgi:transcriptional regulator with GAF, ATPase, and Fis domain
VVRDLASTNGTLVDGQRVEEAALEPNAELRVGDAIFKLVGVGGAAYSRYFIDGGMAQGHARMTSERSALLGGFQMDQIGAAIERIATSMLSVLLLGESGTGKEVAAREIHEKSGRRGQFSAVNCAALPDNLIESELFGYKKGAFSGADRDKMGLIQAAHQGTLLLDEIGDMPLSAQAKLLRVLQSREVLPIGATRPETVDVRVVAATHRDLSRLQKQGKFRRDLFARLNEFPIVLPPLRDRKEDIFQLVATFVGRTGRPDLVMSFPFIAGLLHHDWPYNVRELEAAIKRAATLVEASGSGSPILLEEHLPDSVKQAINDYARTSPRTDRTEPPTELELRELLEREQGNVAAVGRHLGKARMQVHRWMKKYGIDVDDFRA